MGVRLFHDRQPGDGRVMLPIMTLHTDAIYENGVLRPLNPSGLDEHQVVSQSIFTKTQKLDASSTVVRDHSAFLNSYVPEDEGLYDDYSAR